MKNALMILAIVILLALIPAVVATKTGSFLTNAIELQGTLDTVKLIANHSIPADTTLTYQVTNDNKNYYAITNGSTINFSSVGTPDYVSSDTIDSNNGTLRLRIYMESTPAEGFSPKVYSYNLTYTYNVKRNLTNSGGLLELDDIVVDTISFDPGNVLKAGEETNVTAAFKYNLSNWQDTAVGTQFYNAISVAILNPDGTTHNTGNITLSTSSITTTAATNVTVKVNENATNSSQWAIKFSTLGNSSNGSLSIYKPILRQCTNGTGSCSVTTANGSAYYEYEIFVNNTGSIPIRLDISSPCDTVGAGRNTSWEDTLENCTRTGTFGSKEYSNGKVVGFTLDAGNESYFTWRWKKENVVTMNVTDSPWKQNTSVTSTNDTQYVYRQLTFNNTDPEVSFSDVNWSIARPAGGASASTCIAPNYCNGTFSISPNETTRVNATASGDWVTNTDGQGGFSGPSGVWEQDTSKTSNQTHQYIKQNVTANLTDLTDGIQLSTITWTVGVRSTQDCLTDWVSSNNIVTLIVPTDGSTNFTYVNASGDCLDESYSNWIQNTTSTGQTFEKQNVTRNVTIDNLDSIDLNNLNISLNSSQLPSNCKSSCSFTRGFITMSIGSGGTSTDKFWATGDWIDDSQTSWKQDTSQTTKPGETAYIIANITVNSSTSINFTNLAYDCSSRSGWTMSTSSGTLAEVNDTKHTIQNACAANKNNVITLNNGTYVQNTGQTSDLSTQYIVRNANGTNSDSEVSFTIDYSTGVYCPSGFSCSYSHGCSNADFGANDQGTCSTGTSITIDAGKNWSTNYTGSGDVLANATTAFFSDPNQVKTVNVAVKITSNLSVNNSASIGFNNVALNLVDPNDATACTKLETVNVASVQQLFVYRAHNCTKGTPTIVASNSFDYVQDTSSQTFADGTAYVKGKLNITSTDSETFTGVVYDSFSLTGTPNATRKASGLLGVWDCTMDTGTIDAPAGTSVSTTTTPVKCSLSNVINKTSGSETRLSEWDRKCTYKHTKTITHTNKDSLVNYTNVNSTLTVSETNSTALNITCGGTTNSYTFNSTNGTTFSLSINASEDVACTAKWEKMEQAPVIGGSVTVNDTQLKSKESASISVSVTDAETSSGVNTSISLVDDEGNTVSCGSGTSTGTVQCVFDAGDVGQVEKVYDIRTTSKDETDCAATPVTWDDYITIDNLAPRRSVHERNHDRVAINGNITINFTLEDINLSKVIISYLPNKTGTSFINETIYDTTANARRVMVNHTFNVSNLNLTYNTTQGTYVKYFLYAIDKAGNIKRIMEDDLAVKPYQFFVSCATDHKIVEINAKPISILSGKAVSSGTTEVQIFDSNGTRIDNQSVPILGETKDLTYTSCKPETTYKSGEKYKAIIKITSGTETTYHIEEFVAP